MTRFDLELFLTLNEEWADRPLVPSPRNVREPGGLIEQARKRARLLEKRFEIAGKRVLEAGCGRAYLTRVLSDEYGCDAVGLDIRAYDEWDGRCVKGDIADPPELAKFDLTMSYSLWEHVEHPYAALESTYRLLRPSGVAYMFANLYRGPKASHRYREVFFPWPHLLFTDDVFEEFYKHMGRRPARAAWVNHLTYLHYLEYFRRIGFGVRKVWTSKPWWDEPFYRRFEPVLGRYPRWDLQRDFIHAVLTRKRERDPRTRRIRELERRLELMEQSTSWRVTAPLRAAGGLIQGLRRR